MLLKVHMKIFIMDNPLKHFKARDKAIICFLLEVHKS